MKGDKEIIWFANLQKHDAKRSKGKKEKRAKQARISAMINNAKPETFALVETKIVFARIGKKGRERREERRKGERKKSPGITLLLKHS